MIISSERHFRYELSSPNAGSLLSPRFNEVSSRAGGCRREMDTPWNCHPERRICDSPAAAGICYSRQTVDASTVFVRLRLYPPLGIAIRSESAGCLSKDNSVRDTRSRPRIVDAPL